MDADPTKDELASSGVEATRRRSAELFAELRDQQSPTSSRDVAR
jgi:hypothetical protein